MITVKKLVVAATFFLAGTSWAQPPDKPAVQVVFEFLENSYRKQLAAQASEVERVAREKLLRDLADRLRFLHFTADPQNIVLRVRLGSPTAGSEMHAVNFQISVEGNDPVTHASLRSKVVTWAYRTATAYDSPLGSTSALGTDIGLRFQQGDHDQLVEKALRVVALGHDGMLVQSKPVPVWVIPFTQDDLCMAFPSYLEIDDTYHTDTGDRSDQFRVKANGIYSATDPKIEGIPSDLPPAQSQSLEDLKSSAQAQNKVMGVYVVRYNRRDPSCSDVVQPPNFRSPGGPE